jgi:CHAD domain-containing protein/predicted DNA-binding protein YlxM (UPF0122 family)
MKSFLNSEEHEKLKQIFKSKNPLLERPAQILLLSDEGYSIRQIAAELNLSRSSVFYWIRRFRDKKMAIFDEPAELKPEPVTEKLVDREGETEALSKHSEFSKAKRKPEKPDKNARPKTEQDIENLESIFPETPGITPEDTIAEAGRKTLLYHFGQMLKNEAGTLAGEDIEALHDMRVATRRMRAAFDVFGFAYKKKAIKPFFKGLRQTGRALGGVRDFDVFMEKAGNYLLSLRDDEQHGLDPLLILWQNQRELEREEMIAHLKSSIYSEFKKQFSIFLKGTGTDSINLFEADDRKLPDTVRNTVPLLIYQRLAAVNVFEPLIATASTAQLHALRIEYKRLRYTLEFFVEILAPQAKWVIKEIKIIQDHLGDLNDADIAINLLGEILRDWENQHRHMPLEERPNPKPVIHYLAYRIEERHQLIQGFKEIWSNFSRPEFRRQLALAVAM